MKTAAGLSAGALWAFDTVILGIALSQSVFLNTEQAIFLAPFVSAFLHDTASCIWMFLYMGIRRQYQNILRALGTRSGRFIIIGALFGGSIGMTGYVFAIRYLGAAYTAMASALYPALGAILSYIFLKEHLQKRQLAGFCLSLMGLFLLGALTKGEHPQNFILGCLCALLCVIGWATEVVICAYGMKNEEVRSDQALMIRQTTSALFYGLVILQIIKGTSFAATVLTDHSMGLIVLAALCGTLSYLCYYRTIHHMGPSKAMALNITYTAWAMIFELILLGHIPRFINVLLGLLILTGALITAADPKDWKQGGNTNEVSGN